ncbi:hypothetical protein SAMN05421666_3480 [Roseovarius nanhaiticus]|uniref:Membrane-anchored ribosome-binding protein, inhibits growth in stationary phase, ElaB/YqjD/DUF883 family n=1 Tax=Roseovarius nanhaiticus TaxID=573024 RepID=A0A1N7HN37_9RHOB|nr:hypothetical protein [Roseovarius nanhaiticus]SEL36913.1 hypothetical protein SAMN05216208_3577 [Roseovarius nanhaiticus]SIS26213.1 hypothetical protein SAMN05421666_3480 [Roseovarius nanhaiticus]
MTDPTSKTSEDLKQQAKTATADLKESARETAKDAAGAVRSEASRRAESAKSGVAGEVSDVASALRKAADDMRDGSPQERTFGQIAGSLADVSDQIRDKDLGEMANEISSFAKRNPLLFLGGAALAGFAATRFATASARRGDDGADTSAPVSASSVHASRGTAVQTNVQTGAPAVHGTAATGTTTTGGAS